MMLLECRRFITIAQQRVGNVLYKGVSEKSDDFLKFQIYPAISCLFNSYETILSYYFRPGEDFTEDFDHLFLTEIKELVNYKSYKDILEYVDGEEFRIDDHYYYLPKYLKLHEKESGHE